MYCTTLSVTMDEVPPVHYMITLLGGPVRSRPTPGSASPELAQGSVDAMVDRTGVLLRNHGAPPTETASPRPYTRSLYLEWVCKLYHQAQADRGTRAAVTGAARRGRGGDRHLRPGRPEEVVEACRPGSCRLSVLACVMRAGSTSANATLL
jgi:ribulose-5-phosphate 4-epimerase/fuculose-1-phosphate aldolase